jgi:hypothetical protein
MWSFAAKIFFGSSYGCGLVDRIKNTKSGTLFLIKWYELPTGQRFHKYLQHVPFACGLTGIRYSTSGIQLNPGIQIFLAHNQMNSVGR